eukprot:COSAG02_NODE_4908_length_4846_cov_1.506214_5_plen_156_part_00
MPNTPRRRVAAQELSVTLVHASAGYQQANDKEEEIMEMIDREADGSDSLEARILAPQPCICPLAALDADPRSDFAGICPHTLHSRRDWLRHGIQLAGETKRPIPKEADPDVFSFPKSDRNKRRCGAAIQLIADFEEAHTERRLCGKLLASSIPDA